MRLRYTRRALADVMWIADFVNLHNPTAALEIETAIRSTINLLADFPMLGRNKSELNARMLGVPRFPYTIYYRVENNEIWIVHIRDDRRRPLETGEL